MSFGTNIEFGQNEMGQEYKNAEITFGNGDEKVFETVNLFLSTGIFLHLSPLDWK